MNIINVSPPHKTSIQHVIQPFRCAKSPLPLFSLSLLRFSPSLLRLSPLTFISPLAAFCTASFTSAGAGFVSSPESPPFDFAASVSFSRLAWTPGERERGGEEEKGH